jgi:hypothetical protein
VPVVLDAIGVVRADGMNEFQVLRKLYRYLTGAAFNEDSLPDFVAFLAS